MKIFNLLVLGGLLILFAASGCSKFEEGSFSLRTKKGRLSHEWKVDKAYRNGTLLPDSTIRYTIEFTREGDIVQSFFALGQNQDSTFVREGVWEFSDNATKLILLFLVNNQIEDVDYWDILRLQNDEMKIREYQGPDTLEIEFVTF